MKNKYKVEDEVWFMPSIYSVVSGLISKIVITKDNVTYTIGDGNYERLEGNVYRTKEELLKSL